ncbi:AI-2E family transporter [Clostridiaceae bacterium 68-1-5]|uniref:AI-2E family transporter n=3 Tax=Suipraeoptans intestinalis TaxID=2606628 RepID=A0A6N7UZY1_9FIRM|nr:AI-2E family transporter [Suipraeoptans intestinalis]
MQEDKKMTEQTQEEQKAYYTAKPKLGGGKPSKLRQQFARGMTYFLVIAASILFYFALLRFTNISDLTRKIAEVLKPVIYGCVVAYLLNPIVKQTDKYLLPVLEKTMKNKKRAEKLSRGTGIFLALLIMVVVVITLFNLLIPELYRSILKLAYNLPGQMNLLVRKVSEIQLDDSTTGKLLKTGITEGTQMFQKWIRTDLLSRANAVMSNLTVGVFNILNEIFKFLVGVIISVYLLSGKETFAKQSKKAVYSIFPFRQANLILHITTKSNEIFGGFIIGKVIDSAIIGVLCFIGLSVLKMPYAILVSVIVGTTNVIPFFGPYIGAIPSAFLIMLEDPMKGLYFIIFILVLQQFDGNILGPKILGDSTGLSAFWVVVSILLGGGMFGFVGMIMGVPTFAVLYYIADMWIKGRLEKKELPLDSNYYDMKSYVDDSGQYFHEEGKKGLHLEADGKDKKDSKMEE